MLSMVLSFPAANGDPAMFANAGRVVIDRSPNRHAAFGLGIHRCLGSNLARGSRKSLTSRWPRIDWLNGRPEVWADRAPCRSYLAQIDGFQVPRPPPGCEAPLQSTHAARFLLPVGRAWQISDTSRCYACHWCIVRSGRPSRVFI
jgi:hypothetical protein